MQSSADGLRVGNLPTQVGEPKVTSDARHAVLDAGYRALKDFGVPVVLLAVLLWFLRDAAVAMHKTVVEPVVAAHLEFLRETQKTLGEIGEAQLQQVRTMQEISAAQRDLQRIMEGFRPAVSASPSPSKDPG